MRCPLRGTFVVLALSAVLAGCGDDDEDRSPAQPPAPPATTTPATTATPLLTDVQLERLAREHAERELGVQTDDEQITLLRSRVDSSWALVDGNDGSKLWAVWLRDGKVEVASSDAREFDPPSVPCDVRPAFSEPSC